MVLTALPELVASVGAPRIVRGVRIEHVCGDPSLPPDQDRALRRQLFDTALAALGTAVVTPTVFEPGAAGHAA